MSSSDTPNNAKFAIPRPRLLESTLTQSYVDHAKEVRVYLTGCGYREQLEQTEAYSTPIPPSGTRPIPPNAPILLSEFILNPDTNEQTDTPDDDNIALNSRRTEQYARRQALYESATKNFDATVKLYKSELTEFNKARKRHDECVGLKVKGANAKILRT